MRDLLFMQVILKYTILPGILSAMKPILTIACALLLFSACRQHDAKPDIISLTYTQPNIQKQFDTLYNYQLTEPQVYTGLTEQALANCHDSSGRLDSVTQDVFSSMYLDTTTHIYDCITTTVFRLPNGTISATGVFVMAPGTTIAPDHDFPIIGGSGAYSNIYGTYTRKYRDSVYHVELKYYRRDK